MLGKVTNFYVWVSWRFFLVTQTSFLPRVVRLVVVQLHFAAKTPKSTFRNDCKQLKIKRLETNVEEVLDSQTWEWLIVLWYHAKCGDRGGGLACWGKNVLGMLWTQIIRLQYTPGLRICRLFFVDSEPGKILNHDSGSWSTPKLKKKRIQYLIFPGKKYFCFCFTIF